MRSIPQRTTPQRPPGQPSSGRHIGYGGGPQRQPITTGFGGEGSRIMGYEDPRTTGPTRPPGQPSSGRHMGYGGPQPLRTGFGGEGSRIMGYEDPSVGSGDFLSSRYGGGLDDVAGMDDDARGMIEGAGFDIAGKTTDDRVIETLWGKAVNSLPVGTPQMEIEKEWERLKEIYFGKKYT